MTAPALLTLHEAAEYLGISTRAIHARINAGTLRISRVEHKQGARPERLWFTRAALDESNVLARSPGRTPAIPTDSRTAAALKGAYRGPKLSDEHNAATYAQWVQRRRARLGGAALTY